MNKYSIVCLICCLFLAQGCARSLSTDPLRFWGDADPREDRLRREAYVVTHSELAEEQREKILRGELWEGMSKDEVVGSRGLPHDIWRNYRGDRDLEKWIYRYNYYFSENFLVFDRTSLIEWQEGWEYEKS